MLNILFLSHTYWGSEFRVGSHHLSKNMAEAGHTVFYIPMPVTPFHLIKYRLSDKRIKKSGRLEEIQKNLYQYIPRTLIPAGELTRKSGYDISFATTGRLLRSLMSQKNIDVFDLVFLDHPKLIGILHIVKYKKLIYRPTDILSGIGLRGMSKCEGQALVQADGLITTSKPVFDHLEKKFTINIPHLTLVNGVDLDLFTTQVPPPEDIKKINGKKCIYVGAFDDRFDYDGTVTIIERHPNINFIFIGPFPTIRKNEFCRFSNVHILGTREFSQIPAYLQACDISIMPFSNDPSNEGRSPMKLYEYLAAGLPVISRHTDEISRRNHPRILTYTTLEEAHIQIQKALTFEKTSSVPEGLSWKSITEQALQFSQNLH